MRRRLLATRVVIALSFSVNAVATAGLFSCASEPVVAALPRDAGEPLEPPAWKDVFQCVEEQPRPTC
jgi:hypothetical protein